MEIKFKSLKKQIEEYYKSKLYFEEVITDQKRMVEIIKLLRQPFKKEVFDNFRVVDVEDKKILFYDSFNTLSNRSISHIIFYSESNLPIFKIDFSENNNEMVSYRETTYSIYNEDRFEINHKVKFEVFTDSYFENSNVVISDNDGSSYRKRQYGLYLKENEILSIRTNNDIYLQGMESFLNRRDLVIEDIYKSFLKIDEEVKYLMGEDVKIYNIKRKNIV